MKNCKEIKNRIIEYYYDDLPLEEKVEVEAHIKSCSVCTEELEKITSVLKKVSEVKRPVLSSSLYPFIKEKLEKKRVASGKFWNMPFAAGVGLLVLLAVFSNSQNISSLKNVELEDSAILANIIELDNKDMDSLSGLELEILADELFMEDNLMTFGS